MFFFYFEGNISFLLVVVKNVNANSTTNYKTLSLLFCISFFVRVQVTVPGHVVDVACGVDHMVALVKTII